MEELTVPKSDYCCDFVPASQSTHRAFHDHNQIAQVPRTLVHSCARPLRATATHPSTG